MLSSQDNLPPHRKGTPKHKIVHGGLRLDATVRNVIGGWVALIFSTIGRRWTHMTVSSYFGIVTESRMKIATNHDCSCGLKREFLSVSEAQRIKALKAWSHFDVNFP